MLSSIYQMQTSTSIYEHPRDSYSSSLCFSYQRWALGRVSAYTGLCQADLQQ